MSSNLRPYNDLENERKKNSYRTTSYLLGRIAGAAPSLKASTDVDVNQAADMIINDIMALAETIDQKQFLPPITLPK